MKRVKDGYLDKIQSKIDLSNKKILEIGCGNGSRTIKLAECGKHVTAIEPDPKLISKAIKDNSRANIDYIVGSAQKLPFKNPIFDLVIFTLSLHHVPEEKMNVAINESVRVLKKKGRIIFLEPTFKGSFFEAELAFGACDGDERKNKALAYYTMLSHKKLYEEFEMFDETAFTFESTQDFIDSLKPKKNRNRIDAFLKDKNMYLTADRRINIFKSK